MNSTEWNWIGAWLLKLCGRTVLIAHEIGTRKKTGVGNFVRSQVPFYTLPAMKLETGTGIGHHQPESVAVILLESPGGIQ